jgi:hypothetical protein
MGLFSFQPQHWKNYNRKKKTEKRKQNIFYRASQLLAEILTKKSIYFLI